MSDNDKPATPQQSRASFEDAFSGCVQTVLRKDGTMLIGCKLGLWSCSGRDHEQVKNEARHYFALYHADGEYEDMLASSRMARKGGTR